MTNAEYIRRVGLIKWTTWIQYKRNKLHIIIHKRPDNTKTWNETIRCSTRASISCNTVMNSYFSKSIPETSDIHNFIYKVFLFRISFFPTSTGCHINNIFQNMIFIFTLYIFSLAFTIKYNTPSQGKWSMLYILLWRFEWTRPWLSLWRFNITWSPSLFLKCLLMTMICNIIVWYFHSCFSLAMFVPPPF